MNLSVRKKRSGSSTRAKRKRFKSAKSKNKSKWKTNKKKFLRTKKVNKRKIKRLKRQTNKISCQGPNSNSYYKIQSDLRRSHKNKLL